MSATWVETKAPGGPYFEVAIIHHTDCGSTLLADDDLRHGFAQRIGVDERTLADTPVLDPARTVRTDVQRVLWADEVSPDVFVSGHVYDVRTGLVTTVVDARSKTRA
jgi:carbonic anhydrase